MLPSPPPYSIRYYNTIITYATCNIIIGSIARLKSFVCIPMCVFVCVRVCMGVRVGHCMFVCYIVCPNDINPFRFVRTGYILLICIVVRYNIIYYGNARGRYYCYILCRSEPKTKIAIRRAKAITA